MFQRLRWKPVSQRIYYNKVVLTYKALNNLTLAYLSNLLTTTAITCNRNLRSSENGSLMVLQTRTSFYIGSFTFSECDMNLHCYPLLLVMSCMFEYMFILLFVCFHVLCNILYFHRAIW